MIVAQLIGGNEIKGVSKGIVIVDGEKLEASYEELGAVCGNISLGDVDVSSDTLQRDYINLVKDYDDSIPEDFVINNKLTWFVCYSSYEIDIKENTLILTIDAYEE